MKVSRLQRAIPYVADSVSVKSALICPIGVFFIVSNRKVCYNARKFSIKKTSIFTWFSWVPHH